MAPEHATVLARAVAVPAADAPTAVAGTIAPLRPAPLPLTAPAVAGPDQPRPPGGLGVLRRFVGTAHVAVAAPARGLGALRPYGSAEASPPPLAEAGPQPAAEAARVPVIRRAVGKNKRLGKRANKNGKRSTHRIKPSKRFELGSKQQFARFDKTLTRGQRATGGFRPHAHKSKEGFRFPSNPTAVGVSSGYHEAALPTDTFDFLRGGVDQGDGTAKLASSAHTKPLQALQQTVVDKGVLDFLLQAADGFRSDTAATILSAPGGAAAGHSGSGVAQSGQSAAHDLLRQACVRILQDPESATVSAQAVTVALGAYVVGSIAPGEVARLLTTSALKAGKQAISTWEARRNDAKERVEGLFSTLPANEQNYVQRHSQAFLSSAEPDPASATPGRHLGQAQGLKRATSLPRLNVNHGAEVAGGKYAVPSTASAVPSTANANPVQEFASASDTGLYITQPFRLDR